MFSIPVGVVYRPNSSKVKNLKTKDYLGKARLIASTDKANMYTGFVGSERRANMNLETAKDDRPQENISYAASNLVRSDLTSRSQRQQSAPPINRNLFPPTPPPDNDQIRPGYSSARSTPANAGAQSAGGMTQRANSVRDGTGAGTRNASRRMPPERGFSEDQLSPKSNPGGYGSNPNYPPPLNTSVGERPRLGTIRTASEPRGPSNKYMSPRADRGYRDGPPPASRNRLFMEATSRRGNEDIDEYPDELYDLYRNTAYSNPYDNPSDLRSAGGSVRRDRRNPYGDRDSSGGSLDDFEMINEPPRQARSNREPSRSRGTSQSRQIDIRNVRIKVHCADDTRYIMVSTTVLFEEFLERVREKFNLKQSFRVKMKDEGDMITVGDRDDWDMAVQTCRREARKSGEDMARLEVFATHHPDISFY